jgi:putative component of membrane protein insertase Oxa1/YidC/SpoIIIJ protein YidD
MRRVLATILVLFAGAAFSRPANPLTVGADLALGFYQKLISPLQGGGICNFSPSCSNFSRQSYRIYGPFWGTLMTFDRLERCNVGAWGFKDRYYAGIVNDRLNDPPRNHYLPARITAARQRNVDGSVKGPGEK